MLDVHSDTSDGDRSPPPSPSDPPRGEPVVPSRLGNFRLLAEHQLDVPPFIKIGKWQSDKTGLKVVWADTPGASLVPALSPLVLPRFVQLQLEC